MSEPLSAETIARMKEEHAPLYARDGSSICGHCLTYPVIAGEETPVEFPCSTALLLAELERRDVMEFRHPKSDGTIGWSNRNQFWTEPAHPRHDG